IVIASCATSKTWVSDDATLAELPESAPQFRLFLIGDQGEPILEGEDPVLGALEAMTDSVKKGAVVFLGDNIYRYGMQTQPPEAKELSERKILKALNAVKNFDGKVIFIPGNHDWWLGVDNLEAQEKFVQHFPHPQGTSFHPRSGCPGPELIELNDKISLVVMDSEWFLQSDIEIIAKEKNCPYTTRQEAVDALREIAETNVDKMLVVAVHHPLFNNGKHAGNFTFKQHLFPLTEIDKRLWIPLPVLGSVYPLLRNAGVSNQDASGELNKKYRESIEKAMACHPNVILASGHEHSLQYFEFDEMRQIVSGSGSKQTPVKKSGDAGFVSPSKGFATIDLYENDDCAISFWKSDAPEKPVFSTPLPEVSELSEAQDGDIDQTFPDSVEIRTDTIYDVSKIKRYFWGEHHRKAWTSKHKYQMLNLKKEKGGLEIYRAGGGFQTTTLFLKDSLERRYVIRTLRKNPTEVLPEPLQQTFAKNIVRDQISASHPFGARMVSPIAKAAGIYYSTPEYYFIPDDPALGQYRKRVSNQPVSMEEFINADYVREHFGHDAKAVVGTEGLMNNLLEKPAESVDVEWYWRTKLVDMLINDWDRHEGQYFWVALDKQDQTIYRPEQIIFEKLQSRRDKLVEFAERYYAVFAENLEIVGKTGNDVFVIEYLQNDAIRLTISANDQNEPYFDRVIYPNETKEIRLYGIDGDDRLIFKDVPKGFDLKFQIIPGKSDLAESIEGKIPRKIKIHTREVSHTDAAVRKENMSDFTEDKLEKYNYNYTEYKPDLLGPAISFGFNSDDGLFLGGGIVWKKTGFRKYPYAAQHKLLANIAPRNGSFNINYEGLYKEAFGRSDLLVSANISAPSNNGKFYGFGNDSVNTGEPRYYNVRRDLYELAAWLRPDIGSRTNLFFGPSVEYTNVRISDDKFYTSESAGLTDSDFNWFTLPAITGFFSYNSTNDAHYPTRGVKVKTVSRWSFNTRDDESLVKSNLSLTIYQKIPATAIVISSRAGGLVNFGEYRFFQANTLGGAGILFNSESYLYDRATFRGAPRDRFAGRSVFYHNTDLRLKISDVSSTVLP
ncbi:MAG: metallophosphoesterase, partial [Flavobacteriales bacterium]|nr:metallophosphoesterase [Flavobacteriales bacterium]